MKTVLQIIEKLREKHYIHDFNIENDKIFSPDTNESFSPGDLMIENSYRYEGDSNPADNAVVYALTARSGTKGILIDSYGAYADPKLAKIISDIPVREEHSMQTGRESQ
jgi:hypothetical protein